MDDVIDPSESLASDQCRRQQVSADAVAFGDAPDVVTCLIHELVLELADRGGERGFEERQKRRDIGVKTFRCRHFHNLATRQSQRP